MYEPMLAFLGKRNDLDRDGYIFEPKLDGTRALCYVNEGIRFINRRGRDITERYPEFKFRNDLKARSCVLDGEIVVYNRQGNPSFSLLQKREQSRTSIAHILAANHPATYVVFDILELDGEDLTRTGLEERRDRLQEVLKESAAIQLIVSTKDGQKLWSIVEERKLEGVMAKRIGSPYEPGKRSMAWIKIKALKTIDCVLIGFTSEKRPISALALGLYFGNELRYMGRVGTGFTERSLEQSRPVLDSMMVDEPPVKSYPDHPTIWIRPELVVEIEYLQLTGDGHLRAPSFRRFRDDKGPKECTAESAGIEY
ncbi:MAG TPA: non-homologous end-joining DNA ligase [Methanomassiliicoccales archaeon]|nr:non-homologous end-joining DNA ligase [Methanomassiliicoccales archaeon]